MNFYREHSELIFGTRLKRLSERFLNDISKVYKSLGIPFEISWFPIFYLLDERERLSVTEIARELEITHSAVSQMLVTLEKKNLVQFHADKSDKRKRLITFTGEGKKLVGEVRPVWQHLRREMRNILNERKNSSYLLKALDELDESMNTKGLYQRIMDDIKKTGSYVNS